MRAITAVMILLATAGQALGQQESFEEVVARLKLPTASARMSAMRLLEESGYPEAGAPVAALLGDPDDQVQRAAVYVELGLFLGTKITPHRHVRLIVEVRNDQPAARAFDRLWASLPIAPVPMEVVTGMLGPIRHQDTAFRVEATYALGVLGQIDGVAPAPGYKAVAEALAERLGDPEPAVRTAVARSAGRVFHRCAAPCEVPGLDRLGDALVRTLNDPERAVYLAALEALGDLRYARAVSSLVAAYDYERQHGDARPTLQALARIGHPSSAPLFKAVLAEKDADYRRAGAEGLARIGGPDAAQALSAAETRELRAAQAFAAAMSGDTKAIDRVVEAVDSGATRAQARDYLIEIGKPAASRVAAGLSARDSQTRTALIEALSVIGGPAELPAIELLQRVRNGDVAAAAESAAQRIKARSPR